MSLRVVDRLGVADVITLANAVIGVGAMAGAILGKPMFVAQLLLLGAVADALDGIFARSFGGTAVGPYLDSMADIVSFGTATGLFVFAVAQDEWGTLTDDPELLAAAVGAASIFVVFSLVRTALYTVHVDEDENRPGIQNTLGASILAAAYLSGLVNVPVFLAATVALSMAMVAPVPYPKLRARDAIVMGTVQMGAILLPTALGRVFPRVLLVAALAYMFLGPRFYWSD
ncbi:archaetidylserine synthase [Halovenus aranensis]|jgi:CDP-diacylglycerol--serine O-phosphatidyltransferase|uniref:Archaetidylserine synthase n=1 Tax=Halovenus aranensis TaxID=890420 RepID=A0A1G8VBP2_9EURY|nr:protein sorting system archaetidylserine synthase [Halovenus aranensis]SDJ63536.1 archaetidylserine synthase [Halovenus aranensis]